MLGNEEITDQIWSSVRDDKKMSLNGKKNNYKTIYNVHNKEVKKFFEEKNRNALHIGNIEDESKWIKIGKFLNLDVSRECSSHKNKPE